jgi:DNA primase
MSDPVLELIQKQGLEFKSSGPDYLVHCLNPEHPDTNPSMRVDKQSGAFHCFSCGFKGNLFKYYGVFTNQVPIKLAKLREKLSAVKSATTGLDLPKGAIPWVKTFRGISADTLKYFEAFYTLKEEKLLDRICFPVKDITGKTVVHVCRHTLSNGNPRYLNYPANVQVPLFPARAPTGAKSIVLVEGLFDFLNLYDNGLDNAVCCFGTNTLHKDTKLKLLPFKAQGITKVYVMFDGDDAGAKAAEQLKPSIEAEGFVVEIITLPHGTDPGELDREEILSISEYIKTTVATHS